MKLRDGTDRDSGTAVRTFTEHLVAHVKSPFSDITSKVTGSGVNVDERSERATCSDSGSPFCYPAICRKCYDLTEQLNCFSVLDILNVPNAYPFSFMLDQRIDHPRGI